MRGYVANAENEVMVLRLFCTILVALVVGVFQLAASLPAAYADTFGDLTGFEGDHRTDTTSARLAKVDIATSGVGAHTYRIPALEKLPDGTLIAAYDRRNNSSADLPGDIEVLVERSSDGGRTWTEPTVVSGADTEVGSGDPSLIVDDETGRIHLFYASGNGFRQSGVGNANDDPNLIHLDYAYSDDGGRTWTERRLTEEVKDPAWKGIFASSGTGIQLEHGDRAGRLIQQYAFQKVDGSIWAVSVYSDDRGRTWRAGQPVGPLMDENKTVELADGRIMLNSRTASGSYRLVAHSNDGGVSYDHPTPERELVDPTNNASIIRYDEQAAARQPESHWLLFSNTADATARRNLTIKMSCNDGRTWPISKTVEPGAAAYSTLLQLGDGTFGLLYERGVYQHITFTRFDAAWLGADCPTDPSRPKLGAEIVDASGLRAGTPGKVTLSVTNHGHRRSPAGTVTLRLPEGWSAVRRKRQVPALDAGESTTISLEVMPGANVPVGEHELSLRVKAGAAKQRLTRTVLVLGDDPVLDVAVAREYDGVDDFTDLSAELDRLRSLEEGVIAVSVRTNWMQPAGALLSGADTAAPSTNVTLSLNRGVPYFEARKDDRYLARLQGSTSIADGHTHTVALVASAAGDRMYVDGSRIAAGDARAFFGDVEPLTGLWAGRNVDDGGAQWHFGGYIDRITVY